MSDKTTQASQTHEYATSIVWTGNRGVGTQSYRAYDRTWDITTDGKPIIHCSNDPLLGGDESLPNPEDFLLCAVSACHMLWYLHLASNKKIIVNDYTDHPLGIGEVEASGAGRFVGVTLRPHIVLSSGTDQQQADAIHQQIHRYCFIARSLNFPVSIKASYAEQQDDAKP